MLYKILGSCAATAKNMHFWNSYSRNCITTYNKELHLIFHSIIELMLCTHSISDIITAGETSCVRSVSYIQSMNKLRSCSHALRGERCEWLLRLELWRHVYKCAFGFGCCCSHHPHFCCCIKQSHARSDPRIIIFRSFKLHCWCSCFQVAPRCCKE